MALIDPHDLDLLKNEAETKVLEELESQLKHLPDYICTCRECVLDTLALTLNSIKPLYRVTLMGRIYAKVVMNEKAYTESVRKAVIKAIEKVHKNPFHPPRNQVSLGSGSAGHFKQKKKSKS